MTPRQIPLCYHCGQSNARKLKVSYGENTPVAGAFDGPLFCSRRCAASWALIECHDLAEECHWRDCCNRWHHLPANRCPCHCTAAQVVPSGPGDTTAIDPLDDDDDQDDDDQDDAIDYDDLHTDLYTINPNRHSEEIP